MKINRTVGFLTYLGGHFKERQRHGPAISTLFPKLQSPAVGSSSEPNKGEIAIERERGSGMIRYFINRVDASRQRDHESEPELKKKLLAKKGMKITQIGEFFSMQEIQTMVSHRIRKRKKKAL